ncbi:MAG: S9 family peptidase, partial [Burkholderiales bacterium]
SWLLDQNNVPRAAISQNGKTRTETFWFRDGAATPWRKISSAQGEAPRIIPAGFDADGSLLVYANLGSDKFKLYEFDPVAGKPTTLVLEHPLVDLDTGTLLTRLSDHRIVGMRIEADKPEVAWFDQTYAGLQKLLDASLPSGNFNQVRLLDDGKVSIFSSGDRDPGQYYLFDPKIKRLEEVLRPQDWIKPELMAATQVVRYKARDGMEIPGYLTLPQGRPASKLPLVALIHGGPWVRDHWGFDPDVQFLANRGYAVFQPNYRGSTGFGSRHYSSSFKQFGQSMQDDITDGVRHLIDKGIVDRDRMCISGGSYGGYATMMGLVKEPDLFKCGIDEAGVVDLIWLQELGYTDYNQGDPDAAEAFQKVAVGDVKADRAMLEKYSPRLHADQIKAPVLIVHAVRDQRVPIAHAEAMRDALKAAGKTYEWVVYADEAHGFTRIENRIDRYSKIEAFLRKHLGP